MPAPLDMRFRKRPVIGLAILACLLAAVAYLSPHGRLSEINRLIQDFAMSAEHRPLHGDIVIVAIDNPSIEALGRWPWRRAYHAELLDRIGQAKPKAIGLDILFSEPDRDHPLDDALLAASLARNGPVVLPMFIQDVGGMKRVVGPNPALIKNQVNLGHAHIDVDDDGVVRRIHGSYEAGGKTWPQFALAVEAVAEKQVPSSASAPTAADVIIPYAGGPGYFPRVSYVDVIRGTVPPAVFRNKNILIGVTAEGIADKYATPALGEQRLMPGVEILANVVDSMKRGITVDVAMPVQNMLLNLGAIVCALAGFMLLRPFTALCLTLLLACTLFAATYVAVGQLGLLFNPAAGILGLLALYLLWSWYRLDTAARYLAAELESLQQQGMPLFTETDAPLFKDFLDRRIAAVEGASHQLKLLHRFVIDAVDTIPYPVLTAGKDGSISLANAAAARHFDLAEQAELIGRPALEFLDDLISTAGIAVFHDVKIFASSQAIQTEARDRRGRELIVKSLPIFNSEHVHIGWIISLVDISEMRQAERAREEAFRFIAHDMRAPLSSIISILEIQRMESSADHALLDRIDHCVSGALVLADDVLNLSRAESGDYHLEQLNLSDILAEAINESWSRASLKNINIQVSSAETQAYALLDRHMLKRALLNLLSNAIKFSPSDALVICRLAQNHDDWEIAIEDFGPGIAPELQALLFRPFTRLHTQSHPEIPGTGLGLAFVHAVITRHGGNISVKSAAGAGSTFRIRLPAHR
jgi:CHASE2 domain-containing sensor protein/signal transduction histidine kinase